MKTVDMLEYMCECAGLTLSSQQTHSRNVHSNVVNIAYENSSAGTASTFVKDTTQAELWL